MAPRPVEHPDPEWVQQRTVRVLVAAQVLGRAAIGVGAAVSPLLAKETLGGDDTFAGVAFAALTHGLDVVEGEASRSPRAASAIPATCPQRNDVRHGEESHRRRRTVRQQARNASSARDAHTREQT